MRDAFDAEDAGRNGSVERLADGNGVTGEGV